MRVSYEQARDNPGLRVSFLENVDMGEYTPFIRGIFHVKRDIPYIKNMVTIAHPSSTWLKGLPSIIAISSKTFDKYSEEEFLNVLIHHEGFHALQNYFELSTHGKLMDFTLSNGIKISSSELEARQEIEAYQNQINHPSFLECSNRFQDSVRRQLSGWEDMYRYF